MVTNERRTNDNRVNLEQVRLWTVNRADFCKNHFRDVSKSDLEGKTKQGQIFEQHRFAAGGHL